MLLKQLYNFQHLFISCVNATQKRTRWLNPVGGGEINILYMLQMGRFHFAPPLNFPEMMMIHSKSMLLNNMVDSDGRMRQLKLKFRDSVYLICSSCLIYCHRW